MTRTDSTEKIKESYKDEFSRLASLHKETQDTVTAKDRLQRYTVKSNHTEKINKDFAEMQSEIDNMVFGLEKKVRSDEYKFMDEFTDRLRQLHARYRELENKNMHLSSMEKFNADIDAMVRERDALNANCA